MKNRFEVDFGVVELRESPGLDKKNSAGYEMKIAREAEGYILIHDNTDSVIQQTFAENYGVELGVNFVLVEN